MRPSDSGALSRALSGVLALGLATGALAAPKIERFRVDSEPAGAEVHVITGRAGTTPLSLSERDIYPNRYPQEKVELYGRVILRKAGCQEYRHQVSRADIEQGIMARLDCAPAAVATPAADAPASSPPVVTDRLRAPAAAEGPAGKRLRQLRVIQELHDEGLLSDQEEDSIRRRILQAD